MAIKQIIITAVVIILVYAFLIEPNFITVKKLEIKSNEIKNLRLVFISDFHFSKFAGLRLNRLVKIVNEQKPDLIISGGDYVIMHNAKFSMDLNKIASKLSGMETKYGIYSVLGNHDYYRDGDLIKKALKNNGIEILENNNKVINIGDKQLYIAGISDMQTTHYNLENALKDTKKPTVLISHSPDITPFAKDRVDLILAGHTHGGQVRIPFFGAVIVPSKYGKRFESGFLENVLYVTKGIGTSMLHIRFNCLPEITVIDFI